MDCLEQQLIDKYLGIPYVHGGSTLDGLDCWGLLKCVYADLGIRLFDPECNYTKTWSKEGQHYFHDHYAVDWLSVSDPQPLDAVLFINNNGIANHAGVVLSSGRFIHCCRSGVIVSRLGDVSWQRRIEGFYRLKDRA